MSLWSCGVCVMYRDAGCICYHPCWSTFLAMPFLSSFCNYCNCFYTCIIQHSSSLPTFACVMHAHTCKCFIALINQCCIPETHACICMHYVKFQNSLRQDTVLESGYHIPFCWQVNVINSPKHINVTTFPGAIPVVDIVDVEVLWSMALYGVTGLLHPSACS